MKKTVRVTYCVDNQQVSRKIFVNKHIALFSSIPQANICIRTACYQLSLLMLNDERFSNLIHYDDNQSYLILEDWRVRVYYNYHHLYNCYVLYKISRY